MGGNGERQRPTATTTPDGRRQRRGALPHSPLGSQTPDPPLRARSGKKSKLRPHPVVGGEIPANFSPSPLGGERSFAYR